LSRRFPVSVGLALFVVIVAVFLSWLILDGRGQTQTANPVEVAYPNLLFNQPVGIYSPNDGTDRVFVVEQQGVIRVFNNSVTSASSNAFLDIRNRVVYGGEQGLLGLAFHPNYKLNGYFYVDYVANNPLRTVISRYKASADNPNLAQSDSEFVLLEISQPFSNHKGGAACIWA